ncbi:unnamed protein product [Rangifer tarandus platyrhynchus]|uniref:Uncharacterized protein n=1 Tax=Rangifer tarandus platyrhynchus TaxID=3082113 RepID=A0ABN8ZMU4_RANTA|nr:unnamed protein product [Rangifer tarandus platyrhynchus]
MTGILTRGDGGDAATSQGQLQPPVAGKGGKDPARKPVEERCPVTPGSQTSGHRDRERVTEEKQSRSLCPAASAAYAQSWRRGSPRAYWSGHEPARGEQMTCVRVLPGSLPQGLRTLAGSWSRDIYILEEGQARAWPTRSFLSIRAMGARAEPEHPRGRPVTHKRPRAKHQPWERAVPSALRTSGVSGHFINSSP